MGVCVVVWMCVGVFEFVWVCVWVCVSECVCVFRYVYNHICCIHNKRNPEEIMLSQKLNEKSVLLVYIEPLSLAKLTQAPK